jgi:hypothetical protein
MIRCATNSPATLCSAAAKTLWSGRLTRKMGVALPDSRKLVLQLDFAELHRSHPLVTVLADHLIENALQGESTITARSAATITDAVDVITTVYLLRLRHQLGYVRRRQPYQMMAEETVALAVRGRSSPEWLSDEATAGLLECQSTGNLPREAIHREVAQALDLLQARPQRLEALAHERAQALLADHRQVREAAPFV